MEEPSETLRSALSSNLETQWIVGFVDGEGCFYVGINKHSDMTCGYQVLPEFTVVQHERDIQILHALKKFFRCGVVRSNHGDRMAYRVRDIDHLRKTIIPFFERHSLKTKKKLDFVKFRKIIMLMDRKEHLTMQGIEKIKEIAASMNRGSEDKVQPY
jgi:LAGLIDADG endonuclease